jgi:hypothetical protein
VSSSALLHMCRTGCWFNGLLYAFFGDHWGKFILGGLWYLGGVWLIFRGAVGRRSARHKG